MNPFATLVDQVTRAPTRPPRPSSDDGPVYLVTIRREYRPTGATALMLAAMESRGPMSSSELASAGPA